MSGAEIRGGGEEWEAKIRGAREKGEKEISGAKRYEEEVKTLRGWLHGLL